MNTKQHSFHCFGSQAITRCVNCNEVKGSHSEFCHTRESLLEDVAELQGELDQLRTKLAEIEKQDAIGVFSGAFRFSEGKSYFEVRCYDALPADGAKIYTSPAQQSPAVAIPDFLLEMSQQMREQPSRSTSHPFWQVRCKRYIVTEQGYNEHHWEICGDDGVIYSSLDPIEDLHEYLNENHSEFVGNWNSFNEAESIDEWFDATDDNLPDGLRLVYVQEIEEVVSTHLTEVGAKAFIDRKQHDYPKLYTYVESAYWSPQLRQLQDWIISLSAPTPPSAEQTINTVSNSLPPKNGNGIPELVGDQKLSESTLKIFEQHDSADPIQHTPSDAQLEQIFNGIGERFVSESCREFLRVWIRDWTMHKLEKLQRIGGKQ